MSGEQHRNGSSDGSDQDREWTADTGGSSAHAGERGAGDDGLDRSSQNAEQEEAARSDGQEPEDGDTQTGAKPPTDASSAQGDGEADQEEEDTASQAKSPSGESEQSGGEFEDDETTTKRIKPEEAERQGQSAKADADRDEAAPETSEHSEGDEAAGRESSETQDDGQESSKSRSEGETETAAGSHAEPDSGQDPEHEEEDTAAEADAHSNAQAAHAKEGSESSEETAGAEDEAAAGEGPDGQRSSSDEGDDGAAAESKAESEQAGVRGDEPTQPALQDAQASAESQRPVARDEQIGIRAHYFGITHVGEVRDHNEDNFLVADLSTGLRDLPGQEVQQRDLGASGAVFAVCDGMGGAAAGEVASQMAVDTLFDVLKGSAPPHDRDEFARRLVRAIEEAGMRIFSAAKMDRTRRGMGTTATVAGLTDKVLFIGQVGDSRAYVLRNGELGMVSKDQSLVNQLIEAGQLSEDEAETFEHSNIILQALGTTEDVSVDLTFLELRQGDRIMLCSDGLSGLVHDEMIQDVLASTPSLRDCCERLIEMANAAGGHDNVTVVAVDVEGEALATAEAATAPVYQQYPLPPPEYDDDESDTYPAREPSTKIRTLSPKPGRDVKTGESGGSRAFRWPLILAVLGLVVIGVATMSFSGPSGNAEGTTASSSAEAEQDVSAKKEPEPEQPVEVHVSTDVQQGELFIDGRSYGLLGKGEPVIMRLRPGAYRFEARSGGSVVASANVTVQPGTPTDVILTMPSGKADAVGDGGAASTDAAAGAGGGTASRDAAARRRAAKAAERRRQRRRRQRKQAGGSTAQQGRTDAAASEPAEEQTDGADSKRPAKEQEPSTSESTTGSGASGAGSGTPEETAPSSSSSEPTTGPGDADSERSGATEPAEPEPTGSATSDSG